MCIRDRAAAEHGRESLRLIEAATPQAEISFLCGEIRRLVASEGIRYREIAVITGDLETYSREILRQFEKKDVYKRQEYIPYQQYLILV